MPDGTIPILFVIGSLEIGGAEKQLVEIAIGLDRTRFSPTVCSLAGRGPLSGTLERAGVPVVEIGLQGASKVGVLAALAGLPGGVWRFLSVVRRQRPAVLHGMLFHAYVLGAIAGALTRVPVVVASRRSLSHFKRHRLHYRIIENTVNGITTCIVANSEAVRQDTLETERLRPEDVLVIHNGIDAGRYTRPRDPALREALGLGSGPVAIVLANFIHYKGHQYFFEAWAEVLRTHPDATALLVGDGPLRRSHEESLGKTAVGRSLRFLGTRSDVPELLAVSDLLVHPSLEEGFSNALLEGMAAGLPVVATAVGGNPEAVLEGVTGHLVPSRDAGALARAMLQVWARPDRGRAMGEAGRARVLDEFQLPVMVRRYEDLYVRLLEGQDTGQHHVRNRRTS